MRTFVQTVTLLSALLSFSVLSAQLTVTGGQTPQQLADLLIGGGITISNVTMNCPTDASGTFDGSTTNLNVNSGVLLTSGTIANAALPQTSPGITGANGTAGDTDLDVTSGVPTFDACALEFDMVATCDTISIAYVFASDEYDEWVCATVNDVFGFFIDGPGLANVNIAVIPGTTVPVSINSVNNGSIGANGSSGTPNCNTANSAFFVSNNTGVTHEYDGQTVRLEAKTWVQPCSTYHVKLVVADGGDDVLDSGVFLEEGGIQCSGNDLEISTGFTNGSSYLVEGCTDAVLHFVRDGNLSQTISVSYSVGGTATNGVDYNSIADSVVFGVGQDSVTLMISAIDDGLNEGIETIFIVLEDSTCGSLFSDTARIEVVDPPVADFNYTSACPGVPAQFTDASFFPPGTINVFNWDFGDGGTSTLQNPDHTFANQGVYTVTLEVETPEGCRDTTSQTIEIFEIPTAAFTVDGFCLGQPTNFTDQSVVSAGDMVQSWDWDLGDGNTSSQQNPIHNYGAVGAYSVSLIVSNMNGCNDTIAQTIEINPLPQVAFDFGDTCDGNAVQFENTTTIVGGTIAASEWDLGDGNTSTAAQFSHLYAAPDSYLVQLTVTSDLGCIDSIEQEVVVHPNPVVDFGVSFACLGDTSYFTDQSTLLSGTNASWDWDFGNGDVSTVQNPAYQYPAAGLYSVALTVTSDQGCAVSYSQPLDLPAPPDPPQPLHDTICTGFAPVLGVVPPPTPGTVFWYPTQNAVDPVQIGGNVFEPGPLVNTTFFFVNYLSPEGCRSAIAPVYAIVNAPPNVPVEFSDTEVELPHAIVEFAADPPSNVATELWNFGDGATSNQSAPVHEYAAVGQYDVTYSYTDINGCENEYFWPLMVNVTEEVYIYVPNAFSPNGDDLNDEFSVVTRLITDFNIQMFDRWGKLLYASDDLSFGWDGKDISGQPVTEGVYVYRIVATTYSGDRIDRSGSVTVIR